MVCRARCIRIDNIKIFPKHPRTSQEGKNKSQPGRCLQYTNCQESFILRKYKYL